MRGWAPNQRPPPQPQPLRIHRIIAEIGRLTAVVRTEKVASEFVHVSAYVCVKLARFKII